MESSEGEEKEEKISVSVRLRPLSEREIKKKDKEVWKCINKTTIACDSVAHSFDNVFGQAQTTAEVYDKVARGIVSSILEGMNGTIFAYGQTASGKTFTMTGNEENPGILPLATYDIFERIASMQNFQFLLHVSYIEIFNEQVKDLLSDNNNNNLRIREDRDKGFYVENITMRSVVSVEELLDIKTAGERRRHIGETNMNLKSSRSHTIFTIKIEMRDIRVVEARKEKLLESENLNEEDIRFGVLIGNLNLVDLAGSENARATGAIGDRLAEAGNINKSLLTLSRVISQLAKSNGKTTFINWRDSKLTQILQSSLAGNCKTAVICCVTPASQFMDETKSTLSFAGRAKLITTHAVVNEILDGEGEIQKLKATVKRLQLQLEESTVAVEEKKNLEDKIKALTAIIVDRGGRKHERGENTFPTDAPTKERKRRKKAHRETWCPGEILPSLTMADIQTLKQKGVTTLSENEAKPMGKSVNDVKKGSINSDENHVTFSDPHEKSMQDLTDRNKKLEDDLHRIYEENHELKCRYAKEIALLREQLDNSKVLKPGSDKVEASEDIGCDRKRICGVALRPGGSVEESELLSSNSDNCRSCDILEEIKSEIEKFSDTNEYSAETELANKVKKLGDKLLVEHKTNYKLHEELEKSKTLLQDQQNYLDIAQNEKNELKKALDTTKLELSDHEGRVMQFQDKFTALQSNMQSVAQGLQKFCGNDQSVARDQDFTITLNELIEDVEKKFHSLKTEINQWKEVAKYTPEFFECLDKMGFTRAQDKEFPNAISFQEYLCQEYSKMHDSCVVSEVRGCIENITLQIELSQNREKDKLSRTLQDESNTQIMNLRTYYENLLNAMKNECAIWKNRAVKEEASASTHAEELHSNRNENEKRISQLTLSLDLVRQEHEQACIRIEELKKELDDVITKSEKTETELNLQIEDLRHSNNALNCTNDTRKNEIKQLRNKIQELSDVNEQATEISAILDGNKEKENNEQLQKELKDLQFQKEQMLCSIKALEKKIQNFDEMIKSKDKYIEEIEMSSGKFEENTYNIDKKEEEFNKLEERCCDLESAVNIKEAEIKSIKNRLKRSNTENTNLVKELALLRENCSKAEAEIQLLKEKKAANDLHNSLTDLEDKVCILRKHQDSLKQDVELVMKRFRKDVVKMFDVFKQNLSCERKLNEHNLANETAIKILRKKEATLTEALKALEEQIADSSDGKNRSEMEKLQTELDKVFETKKCIETRNKELENENAEIKALAEKRLARIQKLEKTKLSEAQCARIMEMKRAYKEMKVKHAEVMATNENLAENINVLKEHIKRKQASLKEIVRSTCMAFGIMDHVEPDELIRMITSRVHALQAERDALESELQATESDAKFENLQKERDSLKQRVLELSEMNERFQNQHKVLTEQLNSLSKDYEMSNSRAREFGSVLSREKEALLEQIDILKQELQASQAELENLKVSCDRLYAEKENSTQIVKSKIVKYENHIDKLKMELSTAKESLATTIKEHKQSIRFLEKENLELMVDLRKLREASQHKSEIIETKGKPLQPIDGNIRQKERSKSGSSQVKDLEVQKREKLEHINREDDTTNNERPPECNQQ